MDVPGALSAGCRKIRPVGIGMQIARRSHPLAASCAAAAAATYTPVMRLCMCWFCMSRAHDPDPGTPGDLDPSRVRKLLHRKGVCYIDDRADGPACMHSRDSIAQCMTDMLEIAQVRGVRLRYGSEGPPVRMSGTSTTSRRHMGRHSSVVRGKQASSRSPPGGGQWIHNKHQVGQVCSSERVDVSHFLNQNSFRVIRLRATSRHHSGKDFPLSEPTSKLPGTRFDLAGGYAAKLSPCQSAPCQMRSMFGDVRNPGIRLFCLLAMGLVVWMHVTRTSSPSSNRGRDSLLMPRPGIYIFSAEWLPEVPS